MKCLLRNFYTYSYFFWCTGNKVSCELPRILARVKHFKNRIGELKARLNYTEAGTRQEALQHKINKLEDDVRILQDAEDQQLKTYGTYLRCFYHCIFMYIIIFIFFIIYFFRSINPFKKHFGVTWSKVQCKKNLILTFVFQNASNALP